jgi:hypothetical protein
MTIVHPDGSTSEISDTSLVAQASRALEVASHRMGQSGYRAHLASKHAKRPYTPTAEHDAVVKAMPALLSGEITPEEAMALLHTYDVKQQRLS